MKIQFPQSISNINTVQGLSQYVSNALGKVQNLVNGNVSLIDNADTFHATFIFTKINVDVGVAHTLGRIPTGYLPSSSNNHLLSLQTGKTAWTTQTIYLQAGSTGTVTVVVF